MGRIRDDLRHETPRDRLYSLREAAGKAGIPGASRCGFPPHIRRKPGNV